MFQESRICRSERDVQLGVISEQVIFGDHRTKRSCTESEKEWAKCVVPQTWGTPQDRVDNA